jgi:hypothetical protein
MWLEQSQPGWTAFTVALSGPKSEGPVEEKKIVGDGFHPGLVFEQQS